MKRFSSGSRIMRRLSESRKKCKERKLNMIDHIDITTIMVTTIQAVEIITAKVEKAMQIKMHLVS